MLHIINKSPLERAALSTCLGTARSGTILLIEDAVYAATRGHAYEAELREALGRFKVCVLQPDLEARGMADRLMDGVSAVGYEDFVDLVAAERSCQSWL